MSNVGADKLTETETIVTNLSNRSNMLYTNSLLRSLLITNRISHLTSTFQLNPIQFSSKKAKP